MTAALLRLAAGQGHIDRAELVDREGLANGLDATERLQQRVQPGLLEPEDLDVEVLGGMPAQTVAHKASHGERPATGVGHGAGDATGLSLG